MGPTDLQLDHTVGPVTTQRVMSQLRGKTADRQCLDKPVPVFRMIGPVALAISNDGFSDAIMKLVAILDVVRFFFG